MSPNFQIKKYVCKMKCHKKYRKILLPLISLMATWICLSCVRKNEARLLVDIPVGEDKMVQVFNLTARTHVYRDTLNGPLRLDTLPYGICQVAVMWPRDVISAGEYRTFGPHAADEQAYYSVQKFIFIDPEHSGTIRLHVPEGMTKAEIEERLLDKNRPFFLLADAEGGNSRLFEEYQSIQHRAEEEFLHKRDSLTQMLYAYNDRGDLENAQRINGRINDLWQKEVRPKYDGKEKQFLMAHVASPIVPFILYDCITDAETYRGFKPIIDALPQKHRNLDFMQNLETFLTED